MGITDMKKELLAPAGDIEAGYAALYYGADAVYLGLQQFSARATATNFSESDLDEFTAFAHSKGRKVFVAINTLVQESELADLLKTLDICSRCKVDAVILQDLGAARVVREKYPELEMHASTQMAVHNKEGALALKELGFSRVVLARELTRAEIEEIAAIPGLETEAFIHGALCYSYSGLCLFSSMETGKSANRGKCLYPCRACFKGEDGERHYFSMKDMALEEDVLKMPAYSLKIEGRKKSPLYVAAVTDFYRRLLDGKGASRERADNIRQIFSRPWCKFHFKGKDKEVIDRDFVGHRGLLVGTVGQVAKGRFVFRPNHVIARHDGLQIDAEGMEKPFGFSLQKMRVQGRNVFEAKAGEEVEIGLPPQAPVLKKGDRVYLASSSAVKGAYSYERPKSGAFRQRQVLDVDVFVAADKITARAGAFEAAADGSFTAAKEPEKVTEAVAKAFAKTGDTAFSLGRLALHNEAGLFVPVSLLNELRRRLYATVVPERREGSLPPVSAQRERKEPLWIVKTDKAATLSEIDLSQAAEVIFMLSPQTTDADLQGLPKHKLRLALPAVCRQTKAFEKVIAHFWEQGYRRWEVANYWGIAALPRQGADISFDRQIYVLNTQAAEEAKSLGVSRVTLSVEDTLPNLRAVAEKSPLPVAMIVYGDTELFTSAACIRSNPCKECPRGTKWLSLMREGKRYQALSKDCQTMLFDERPFCAAAEAQEIAADFYRVDFLYKPYTARQAAEIWRKVTAFEDVSDDVIKGNLHRHG